MPYALVIHGGAGARIGTDYSRQKADMQALIMHGQTLLEAGTSAQEVVVQMVTALEASGLYVAGKGSAPNSAGTFELDASLMTGKTRQAGAVAGIVGIESPIQAAQAVMEDGRHVLMAGQGAFDLASAAGLGQVTDPDSYYSEHVSHGSAEVLDHGTVGAVALDLAGNLAAGTSTGGTFNKLVGRVGDTPLIGAGTWADDTVAVSSTGLGEAFIRAAAAYDVSARMRYGGASLNDAAHAVLDEVARCDGDGGLITVAADGTITMPYNSDGMKRAAVSDKMAPVVKVFEPEP